jgi:glycosyltransferase involved in cell wall biosynthesis
MQAEDRVPELVDKGGAAAHPQSFLVAFTFSVDPAVIRSCLSRPAVAGVILPEEPEKGKFDNLPNVGHFYGLSSSKWKLPAVAADAVVVLGGSDSVGLRIVRPANQNGINYFVFVDPFTGLVSKYETRALIARIIRQRVRDKFKSVLNSRLVQAPWKWVCSRRADIRDVTTRLPIMAQSFVSVLRRTFRSGKEVDATVSSSQPPYRIRGVHAAGEVLELVDKGGAAAHSDRFLVAFTLSVDPAIVRSCLSRPAVAGVILPEKPEKGTLDDLSTVGHFYGSRSSKWKFPAVAADAVVVLGDSNSVGLRIVRSANKNGIGNFVFVDPVTKLVSKYETRALTVRIIRQRISDKVSTFPPWKWVCSRILKIRDIIVSTPIFGVLPFVFVLRRMFRLGKGVPLDSNVATNTVILILGTLGAGGTERQAVNTALMIKREGHFRPIVVCSRLSTAASRFYRPLLVQAGVEVVDLYEIDVETLSRAVPKRMRSLGEGKIQMLGYDIPDDLFRYLLVFLKERPRVVHAFLDENNIKAGSAAVLAHVPRIVLSTRSVAPDNFEQMVRGYMRPGYEVLLDQKEVMLFNNSNAGARDYRRWLRRRDIDIKVIHNGIDLETFAARDNVDQEARKQFNVPSNSLLVASIMRLSEEKQPLVWARTVVEISRQRPDVQFILVGEGPLRRRVEVMIENAWIGSRVKIVPQTHDVPAILRASDLFLLTSRAEGLPNVLIEAQAVGVPVVTTPAGGAPETLDPGKTGLVSSDHSALAIASSCLTLLDDDELRKNMGTAGAKFVREKFSLDRMYKDTISLYGL